MHLLNLKIISINSLRAPHSIVRSMFALTRTCVRRAVDVVSNQVCTNLNNNAHLSMHIQKRYALIICFLFGFPLSSSQDPSGSSSCVVFYSIYIYTFGSLTYYPLNPLRSLSCTFIYIYLSRSHSINKRKQRTHTNNQKSNTHTHPNIFRRAHSHTRRQRRNATQRAARRQEGNFAEISSKTVSQLTSEPRRENIAVSVVYRTQSLCASHAHNPNTQCSHNTHTHKPQQIYIYI